MKSSEYINGLSLDDDVVHKNRDFDKNPLGDVVMKRLNMLCDRRYYVVVNFDF